MLCSFYVSGALAPEREEGAIGKDGEEIRFSRLYFYRLFRQMRHNKGENMVRKSSLILALISWMASTCVYALGLGDIHVNSALNQNLDASIDLLSVEKGRLDDIRVTLASPQAFERAGVDRPYLLTNLRFKPERLPDGSSVIRVTTQNPVREPFLNFLVEVNWPKGRVVREYTLLLDPPVTLSRAPAPVAAPQIAAPEITPEEAEPAPEVAPAAPPAAVQPEAAAPSVSGMAITDEGRSEYGPVKRGDSLWQIASRNSRSGTDINQMMVAIYRANPNAFFGNNLNNLKSGEILRIPSREEVAEIDRVDAYNQYRQHLNVWMAEKAAKAPSPAAQVAAEETAAPASEAATTQTSAEAAAKPEPEAAPEAELKIATARPEGEGEAGAGDAGKTEATVARLKQELVLAREEAESAQQEGEDLQSRVTDLESQLKLAEKTLALKNEQLAQLQAAATQATETGEEIAAAEEQPAAEQPAMEQPAMEQPAAESPTAEEPAMEQPAAESPMAEEPMMDQPMEEQPAEEPPAAEEAAAEQPAAEQPAMAETAPPVVTPEPKPAPIQPAAKKKAESPGLLDTLLGSPLTMALSVGGLVLVIILIWVLVGRRKSKNDFEESILLGGGDSEVTAESPIKGGGAGPAQVDETSFLSDFSPSDIDALQDETGEVDPLSEADVYIAYGRYQQAEELIRQAIERDPERYPLYYKLFEILHAVKDAAGFTSFVREVEGTAVEESDPSAWQKVLVMGAELAPDSPVFSGGVQRATSERSTDELAALGEDSEVLDLDAITADLDAEGQVGTETSPQDQEEVDLSEFTANMEDTGGLDEIAGSDLDLDLDLDSSLLNLDTDLSAAQGLDFAEPEAAGVGEKTIPSIDILNLAEEEEKKENVVPLAAEADTESFSLDDLEEGGLETDSMFIEAADTDEVNTKLDLARAYIDMGDPEGAQDILDEVLSEGDDAQKREAQRLKEQIS
jgi:pilus assembly protein FimV